MRFDHASRLAILALCLVPSGSWAQGRRVLYRHADAARVTVRSESVGDPGLTMDLYYPPAAGNEPYPAVVFVLAFPGAPPMKDMTSYTSWARLVAAEGFVGILYETSDPEADLVTVLDYLSAEAARLRIDANRLGLWSSSYNTALALKHARTPSGVTPAAFVAYYGLMPTPDGYQAAAIDSARARSHAAVPDYHDDEPYRVDLPMLLVRAGRDRFAWLLRSLDHFVSFALRQNLAVTVINYPNGQHGFDTRDDTDETRAIIEQTLAFLHAHLGG